MPHAGCIAGYRLTPLNRYARRTDRASVAHVPEHRPPIDGAAAALGQGWPKNPRTFQPECAHAVWTLPPRCTWTTRPAHAHPSAVLHGEPRRLALWSSGRRCRIAVKRVLSRSRSSGVCSADSCPCTPTEEVVDGITIDLASSPDVFSHEPPQQRKSDRRRHERFEMGSGRDYHARCRA